MIEGDLMALPSEPAQLVAAKGGMGRIMMVAIDPNAPSMDLLGCSVRKVEVLGPHSCSQPVDCVVGDLDRLVFRLVFRHCEDWAEDLLLEDILQQASII